MGYGLTPELADKLIAMGRAACDYFEHAVGPLDSHKRVGCHICERSATRYECPYCRKPMPEGCDHPSVFACCGEIGHAVACSDSTSERKS